MFCKNCGKEIRDEALFCKWCGNKVIKTVNTSETNNIQNNTLQNKDINPAESEIKTDNKVNKNKKFTPGLIILIIIGALLIKYSILLIPFLLNQ